jgi:hypothetical protein
MSDKSVAALSSAELFAVMLAPALCDTSAPVVRSPTDATGHWAEVVGLAATRTILPGEQKGAKAARPSGTAARQPDLFGGVLDREQPQGRGRK